MDNAEEYASQHMLLCSNWTHRINQRPYSLFLTKDMEFLEFQSKKLLNKVNLKPLLGRVSDQLKDCGFMKDKQSSPILTKDCPFSLGKYIYINLEFKRIYILLHCLDILLVLERLGDESGYILNTKYEQVKSHKLIQSKMQFQTVVEISFHNGKTLITDFQDQLEKSICNVQPPSDKALRSEFRKVVSRLHTTQTELHAHKAITQKEFENYRTSVCFGKNYTRSLHLEEKQPLTKCGDIWTRTTQTNWLVIGVPLAINVSSLNEITLKNIRPLIVGDERTPIGLSYQSRLFQKSRNVNEDSMMDCRSTWVPVNELCLLPDSLFVLLIKLQICELDFMAKYSLILLFDVIRKQDNVRFQFDKAQNTTRKQVLQQQLFLNNFYASEILNKQHFRIPSHTFTQQDFLSTIFTGIQLNLGVHYKSLEDLTSFRDYLINNCQFEKLSQSDENASMAQNMLHNQDGHSDWYDTLILEMPSPDDRSNELKVLWQFYSPNEAKLYLLLNLIFKEIMPFYRNKPFIKYYYPCHEPYANTTFEHTIQQELQHLYQMQNNNNKSASVRNVATQCKKLLQLELQTDLHAM